MGIHKFSTCSKIYAPADLRIHDVGSPELLGQLSLIPEVCPIQILSKSDAPILSTSQLKTRVATNSFASKGRAYFHAPLLLSERGTALRVIAFNTVRQHAILLPGTQFGARRRPHSWKFNNFQYLRNAMLRLCSGSMTWDLLSF